MALLVRKISRAKWPDRECELESIPGDSISELRTSGNTLSFWEVSSIENLKDAVIALATAPQNTKLEKMDIIWLDKDAIYKYGFELDDSCSGDTAASNLANTHRNLCNLTYSSLGCVAQIVIDSILKERYKRVGAKDVVRCVQDALAEGAIDEGKCSPRLLEAIK